MLALWELGQANPVGVTSYLKVAFRVEMAPKAARLMLLELKELGIVRSATAPAFGRGRPTILYAPAVDRKEGARLLARRFMADSLTTPEEFLAALKAPDRTATSE